MNLVSLLVSLNKLSLVAFLITLAFLGYEFVLLQKERKGSFKIKIPNFKAGKDYGKKERAVVVKKNKVIKKTNSLAIFLGLIFLMVFGGMVIIGYTNLNHVKNSEERVKNISAGETRLVFGKGITIYSLDWRPLSAKQLMKMRNKSIIIGVDKTSDKNVKMARIRVNTDHWQKGDVTSNYNEKNHLFYIKYKIKPTDDQLKIEAQLFSQVDGWL